MTIKNVTATIQRAIRDQRVTEREVQKILDASSPSLSNGEVRAIGDLYDSLTQRGAAATIDDAALAKLQSFIDKKGLPIGDAAVDAYRGAIGETLSRVRLGQPVDKPARLDAFVPVSLGGERVAYVDIVKKRFFLADGAGDAAKHWGPLSLPKVELTGDASGVSTTRKNLILSTFDSLDTRGLVNWQPSMPVGQRFATVSLRNDAHVDGYQYQALIPTGAMSPTAPVQDPNRVDTFWVRRSGGIAGTTFFAGPFSLKPDQGAVTDATKQRLLAGLEHALSAGQTFSAQLQLPAGLGVTRVPLKTEGVADGFTYTALVPSGGFPGQPAVDPNQASRMWIERSGGLLGRTVYAGPVDVAAAGPVIDAGGAGGVPLPTNDQMKQTYLRIYEAAAQAGTLRTLNGPPVANPQDFPRFNITPVGLAGVSKSLYVINGTLYHQTAGFGPRGPVATWSEVGPAPQF